MLAVFSRPSSFIVRCGWLHSPPSLYMPPLAVYSPDPISPSKNVKIITSNTKIPRVAESDQCHKKTHGYLSRGAPGQAVPPERKRKKKKKTIKGRMVMMMVVMMITEKENYRNSRKAAFTGYAHHPLPDPTRPTPPSPTPPRTHGHNPSRAQP